MIRNTTSAVTTLKAISKLIQANNSTYTTQRIIEISEFSLESSPALGDAVSDAGFLLRPWIQWARVTCQRFASPRVQHHHIPRTAGRKTRHEDQHQISQAQYRRVAVISRGTHSGTHFEGSGGSAGLRAASDA